MSVAIFNLVCSSIQVSKGETVEISKDILLQEDLGMTSIQMVMLLTKLTQDLGINIMDFTDYELRRIKTVGDLSELLTVKQNVQ